MLVLSLVATATASIETEAEKHLKYSIVMLSEARDNALSRHQTISEGNHISSSDQNDFALFVSYLNGRISNYCHKLYNLCGAEALKEVNCPTLSDGAPPAIFNTEVPDITVITDQEKSAILETEFKKSLSQFDEMLLQEQQRISERTPRQHETGTQSASNGYNSNKVTGNSPASERDGSRSQTMRHAPSQTGSVPSGNTTGTQARQLPATKGKRDLSDIDDDIVARQLKEAAEQETDPEIKEKLWEEYRKYKEGQRGNN